MVLEVKFLFLNREQAAHQLAERLACYAKKDAVVVGISNGGMPVAYHLALELNAELTFVPYEKIQNPTDKSRAIGAVSLDYCVIHEQWRDLPQDFIYHQVQAIRNNLARKAQMLGGVNPPDFHNKIVMLVSDFSETGYEVVACLKTIEKQTPYKIVVAIPAITAEAAREITGEADELFFLEIASGDSIEMSYKDSTALTEVEAQRMLNSYHEKNQFLQ